MGCVDSSGNVDNNLKKREALSQYQTAKPFPLHALQKSDIGNQGWIRDQAGISCGDCVQIVEEEEMTKLPHRHIGVVMAVHQCGVYQVGTGILISKNLVLTCAHVTHCKYYQNKPFPKIYFYPRQYGKLSKCIEVENEETPQEYMSDQKWLYTKAYDYSLLKLKEKVDESGFLPLCGDLPQLDEKTTLSIYGYPESKYEKKNGMPYGVRQFGLTKTNHIVDVYQEAGYMVHRISTEAGQSGAPVIKVEDNGAMVIVGVHVGTPKEETNKQQKEFPELKKVNLTKLTNKVMIERLRKFAMKLEGEIFEVREIVTVEGKVLWGQEQEKMKQWEKEKREKELKERQLEKEKEELLLQIEKMKQEKGSTAPKAANKTKEEYFSEGLEHLKADRLILAVESFQKAMDFGPKKAYFYSGMGLAQKKLGRNEQALASYKKAIEIDPKDAYAYFNMGCVLNQLGGNEEALASFKEAIQLDPKDAKAYYNMGCVLNQLGRKEEAVASFKEAIEIDPKDAKAYYNMGCVLNQLGRKEEAVASYKKAIEIDPKYADAYNNMGNALRDLGRFDEAVTSYHKAIQLDHNVRNTYENLQQLLLNKLKTADRLAESVKFLEGIIAQHPYNKRARATAEALKAELEKDHSD